VTLAALAARCGATVRGDSSIVATGVHHRAQDIEPGWLFAALPGQKHHGIEFLAEAIRRGAVAVLSDREPDQALPWLATSTPRRSTALAAWALAGNPAQRLAMVGVTGTNGKSTVVDLVGRIATVAGEKPGVFGTLAYTLPDRSEPATRTTPEATAMAPLLAELVAAGGTVAVMEVSSHALALDRVAGLSFDVAVWTNLTRDHLDFHSDLEDYFQTKAGLADLLRRSPAGRRVIGADDPVIARLLTRPRPGDLTFGLLTGRDVTATDVYIGIDGTSCLLKTPLGHRPVKLPLIGRHNLLNALAAAAVAVARGWPFEAIVTGLEAAQPLPGRLERVDAGTAFPVLVDYAHTPDGLEQVLTSLVETGEWRIVVVFGCGGDRDPGKRPIMGEVVGRLAAVPIVTSDNPRSEDPIAIVDAVMAGVRASGNTRALAIPDRREAISAALSLADSRCLVLVAGKGHETVQILADKTIPFDDRQVIRELARRRRP
jgi:UDP-N-acetylmuramoyl-L-alanyl-D-glutamate--2,6-diaminopimelate ligase